MKRIALRVRLVAIAELRLTMPLAKRRSRLTCRTGSLDASDASAGAAFHMARSAPAGGWTGSADCPLPTSATAGVAATGLETGALLTGEVSSAAALPKTAHANRIIK